MAIRDHSPHFLVAAFATAGLRGAFFFAALNSCIFVQHSQHFLPACSYLRGCVYPLLVSYSLFTAASTGCSTQSVARRETHSAKRGSKSQVGCHGHCDVHCWLCSFFCKNQWKSFFPATEVVVNLFLEIKSLLGCIISSFFFFFFLLFVVWPASLSLTSVLPLP